MSINELLRELVYDSGAVGALVLDDDGFAIDEFRSDDLFDLQGVCVEYVAILKESRNAATLLESGPLEELSVMTETMLILMRTITDGLVLFLVLPGLGNIGKARYLMRRDIHTLRELLD